MEVIKNNKGRNFKNAMLLTLAISFSFLGSLKALATDNVLQAVQIDGMKDTYNIILRSDDNAEIKKTIQAPNKMMLTLKGIRASKSINTIYNNTADVDSVVVEPTGEDSVKILIQADNVDRAEVNFDTLKTPLGLNNAPNQTTNNNEVVLSQPMQSYKPVYDGNLAEDEASGLSSFMASPIAHKVKNALKNEKISWLITCGLFSIMIMSGIKAIKGKDSEIKVGLSQSLRERDMDLYKGSAPALQGGIHESLINGTYNGMSTGIQGGIQRANIMQPQATPITGANYGLKAYQNGVRSPYVSSEIQRPRPAVNQPQAPAKVSYENLQQTRPAQRTAATAQGIATPIAQTAARPKATNIDSMKFLESMTKIYEKNGRTDLAQGLKTNMKKAKVNMA